MSASCHAFVENAWRKEICTNCFRVREDHKSVSGTGGGGAKNGLINITSHFNNTSNTGSDGAVLKFSNTNYTSSSSSHLNSSRAGGGTTSSTNTTETMMMSQMSRQGSSSTILLGGGGGGASTFSPATAAAAASTTFSGIPRINSTPSPTGIKGKLATAAGGGLNHNYKSVKSQHPVVASVTKSDSNIPRNTNSYNTTSSNINSKTMSQHQYQQQQQMSTSQYGIGIESSGIGSRRQVSPSSGSSPLTLTGGQFVKKSSTGNKDSRDSSSGGGGGNSDNIKRNSALRMDSAEDDTPDGGRRKPKFSVGGPMRHSTSCGKKGILKSNKTNSNNTKGQSRKMNVSFHEEVMEVINYGDEPQTPAKSNSSQSRGQNSDSDSDYEEETPTHPMDSVSLAELLEKNSTTLDEKEFHRLTQKNTNFNSIKTNLLGKTNIEIGPIVGCTGGKSMENSSKPLVSIGTFESRKEPLKIRKKLDEDSTTMGDDESDSKPRDKSVNNIRNVNTKNDKHVTISSPTSSTSPISPLTVKSTLPKVPISKIASDTSQNSNAKPNVVVVGGVRQVDNLIPKPKVSSTLGGQSAVVDVANSATTTAVSTSAASSSTSIIVNKTAIVKKSESTSEIISPSINVNVSGSGNANKEPLKPKSILKNSQQNAGGSAGQAQGQKPIQSQSQSPVAATTTANTNSTSNRIAVTNNTTTTTTSSASSLSNLIIMTEGNNITSKRTSFLRDIVNEGGEKVTASTSNSNGVTIVNTTGLSMEHSLEKDSLEVPPPPPTSKVPSEEDEEKEKEVILKIKEHVNLNLGEKIVRPILVGSIVNPNLIAPVGSKVNFPITKTLTNGNSGTDSEFDDSLEDSGLDIGGKTRTEIGGGGGSEESDEKSGSSSDSGNENDYIDRVKGHPHPQRGLFISVEEEFEDDRVNGDSKVVMKKPAKLSPDSVLFSSASEMSASGSTESIPELSDEKRLTKRHAPPIPQSPVVVESQGQIQKALHVELEDIYANQNAFGETLDPDDLEEESVYDDVSNYKNYKNVHELEAEDESIYDDCSVGINNTGGAKVINSSSGVTGSYNFQDGSRSRASDGLGEDEDDPVILTTRSDGIEFIGIRKIDSETFLRERSPSPEKRFGVLSGGKRERSSSTSPKARRKVNQFFSTIGKKAGAAFSNSHLSNYTRNKSPVTYYGGPPKNGMEYTDKEYKRSMSTDEVSQSRTQEIYATLTPTSLKFKGLAPVLHKLSNIKDKPDSTDTDESDFSKDKMFKKHNKISTSIKKFLRFGSKDEGNSKYDFSSNFAPGNMPPMMISAPYHPPISSLSSSEESSSNSNPASIQEEKLTPPNDNTDTSSKELSAAVTVSVVRKPSAVTAPSKPPPPPPRVHSLDLLNKVGLVGPNGTVKPARPPPPVRHNKVAPSFTSVFNNPTALEGLAASPMDLSPVDILTPPSKPKRKNSVNHSNGVARDLETSYNHITNLNMETLRLIANQPLTKITSKTSNFPKSSNGNSSPDEKLYWSQFDIQAGLRPEPMTYGIGFAFYSAQFEGSKVLLLIQECTSAPGFSAAFQFSCVQTETTFVDIVPPEFIPWEPSDYVKTDNGIKAIISVMPCLNLWRIEDFVKCAEVPQKEKYLALLQAMDYWGSEELSDLLVLKQNQSLNSSQIQLQGSSQLDLPSSLIYIQPIPQFTTFSKGRKSTSKSQLHTDFEVSMKQLLLTTPEHDYPDEGLSILTENDRQMLLQKMSGSSHEIQAQFKLFFQLKLFAPSGPNSNSKGSVELARIRKYRSEQSIQQWLDKERALCMKDAVERSISRAGINNNNNNESISPFKKCYLEFLMQPAAPSGGNSAKAILEMFVELFE